MWDHRPLLKLDLKMIVAIITLMIISLMVISSMTDFTVDKNLFFTPYVKSQIKWFILGWIVFFFFAGFDYRRFYQVSFFLYILMIVLLLGLYIAKPIQSVHRWYRIPFINMNVQPSEFAKIIVVMALGWFLEKKEREKDKVLTIIQLLFIVGIPFILILKQPDLGTALVLYPITLIMCYFANINKKIIYSMSFIGLSLIFLVVLIFTNVLSHEKLKPYFTKVIKEYQYARFNPKTYHQNAAKTSIALGGITGSGWKKSEFASQKWLPAAHTDSVFPAYSEEFGLIGVLFLLFIFYLLVHISFGVINYAKDYYGRLLASGIAVYLAMHIIVNITMMCGFLPISGVPLILITYGGNSVLTTMSALGILQNIYTRRFVF
ncbi:MAG: putative lipid II flippase FtsW [Candidatus Anoxychlamydiales bacterium]|nr:putative lipid II flippase FtsW [Candidatus Anoxychlamydiales bacterium]